MKKTVILPVVLWALANPLAATIPPTGQIHAGWAITSITPKQPVALAGQFYKRISQKVESPCMATVLALETRTGDQSLEQAIMVSCDLVFVADSLQPRLRKMLAGRLPGFDLKKLFLNATHTHSGPVTHAMDWYTVNDAGVMKPASYVDFMLQKIAAAIEQAWKNRAPGGVGWGLGHAVVGSNRRMVYRSPQGQPPFGGGTAAMYGRNNIPAFLSMEGSEDTGIEMLFFWNDKNELTGCVLNIACPSQVRESARYVSSDFWGKVRKEMAKRHGASVFVLPWCGAAGDQSPHVQYRKGVEARMRKLRGDLAADVVIAQRIMNAVDTALLAVKKDIRNEVPFGHHVETLQLPKRMVTRPEKEWAQARVESLLAKPEGKRTSSEESHLRWNQHVLNRYREQQTNPKFAMELHVLRLGDVAVATNPFELFLDFGLRMKTRSLAPQTFVVQLACSTGWYLPTVKAAAGGGYSAIIQSCIVGPEGGDVLVNRTVELINAMWTK
ncbi:MAG: hypothetical protein CMO66_07400 [Verrucomicrobiales bacterium]|nr:hypothetical protein [Verrucomicrobiales bacterium]